MSLTQNSTTPTDATERDDRPVVLLLHSLGTDSRLWRHQVEALAGRYEVLAPNALGHGQSTWNGPITVNDWVKDLYETVGGRAVHVVGLSMGGIQAAAFAAEHPELVRSLTLANSFARLPSDVADARIHDCTEAINRSGMAAYADLYLEQTLTLPLDDSDRQLLRDGIASMPPQAYLASATATFRCDVLDQLPHISCPTLVITGERDAKVPHERTQEILGALGHAEHQVISAGHLSCIENPDSFTSIVTSFIARVDDRAALL